MKFHHYSIWTVITLFRTLLTVNSFVERILQLIHLVQVLKLSTKSTLKLSTPMCNFMASSKCSNSTYSGSNSGEYRIVWSVEHWHLHLHLSCWSREFNHPYLCLKSFQRKVSSVRYSNSTELLEALFDRI